MATVIRWTIRKNTFITRLNVFITQVWQLRAVLFLRAVQLKASVTGCDLPNR